MTQKKKKYDVVVLAPHLDDAVLSCGQHIESWLNQGKKVKVITVFTKHTDSKLLPEYTKSYIRTSGFKSAQEFEEKRIVEDIKAMKYMGVDWEHWGVLDAGFRIGKKVAKYPTKESLLGANIKKSDLKLISLVENKLKKIEGKLFILPYDIGGHVDHLIVKKAGNFLKNKMYYLEFPYLGQLKNILSSLHHLYKIRSFKLGGRFKDEALKRYDSQYDLQRRKAYTYPDIFVGW